MPAMFPRQAETGCGRVNTWRRRQQNSVLGGLRQGWLDALIATWALQYWLSGQRKQTVASSLSTEKPAAKERTARSGTSGDGVFRVLWTVKDLPDEATRQEDDRVLMMQECCAGASFFRLIASAVDRGVQPTLSGLPEFTMFVL